MLWSVRTFRHTCVCQLPVLANAYNTNNTNIFAPARERGRSAHGFGRQLEPNDATYLQFTWFRRSRLIQSVLNVVRASVHTTSRYQNCQDLLCRHCFCCCLLLAVFVSTCTISGSARASFERYLSGSCTQITRDSSCGKSVSLERWFNSLDGDQFTSSNVVSLYTL